MTIAFPCENCGFRFQVDGSLAGKKCKCKQCGNIFIIPAPRVGQTASARPATTSGVRQAAPPTRPKQTATAPPQKQDVYDPYYDANDPYAGFDVPLPGRGAVGFEDEEVLPPRGPRPGTTTKRKKKRKQQFDADTLEQAPWWVAKIGFGLTALSGLIWLFSASTGLALMAICFFVTAFLLMGMGYVGMIVVPFLESAACGLMCLFVPFYSLYYTMTRWDTMKTWFTASFVGLMMLIGPALIIPGVMAARKAAKEMQLKNEIEHGNLTPEQRAERQAELGRLQRFEISPDQVGAAPAPAPAAPAPPPQVQQTPTPTPPPANPSQPGPNSGPNPGFQPPRTNPQPPNGGGPGPVRPRIRPRRPPFGRPGMMPGSNYPPPPPNAGASTTPTPGRIAIAGFA